MTEHMQNANMPKMTPTQLADALCAMYELPLTEGAVMRVCDVPSVMLWGPPGIGKSQAVRQFANNIESRTGKKTALTDVRLLLFNPVDLRGIPTSDAQKKLAIWLKPQIFQMDASDDIVNILFLDEITAAPQSLQAAAYQITLDRVVGEHRLPDNCVVLAAGNRITDRSVVNKMPKALGNRLCHIEIENDVDSWREWAFSKGLDERIIGFIGFKPELLMGFNTTDDDVIFPTPRTWEMADRFIKLHGGDIGRAFLPVAGCVGVGAAVELKAWCAVYENLPDIDGIFEGRYGAVPRSSDTLYALTSGIVSRARKYSGNGEKIKNSVEYVMRLPSDFATMVFREYLGFGKGFKLELLKIPQFVDWLAKNEKYLI